MAHAMQQAHKRRAHKPSRQHQRLPGHVACAGHSGPESIAPRSHVVRKTRLPPPTLGKRLAAAHAPLVLLLILGVVGEQNGDIVPSGNVRMRKSNGQFLPVLVKAFPDADGIVEHLLRHGAMPRVAEPNGEPHDGADSRAARCPGTRPVCPPSRPATAGRPLRRFPWQGHARACCARRWPCRPSRAARGARRAQHGSVLPDQRPLHGWR